VSIAKAKGHPSAPPRPSSPKAASPHVLGAPKVQQLAGKAGVGSGTGPAGISMGGKPKTLLGVRHRKVDDHAPHIEAKEVVAARPKTASAKRSASHGRQPFQRALVAKVAGESLTAAVSFEPAEVGESSETAAAGSTAFRKDPFVIALAAEGCSAKADTEVTDRPGDMCASSSEIENRMHGVCTMGGFSGVTEESGCSAAVDAAPSASGVLEPLEQALQVLQATAPAEAEVEAASLTPPISELASRSPAPQERSAKADPQVAMAPRKESAKALGPGARRTSSPQLKRQAPAPLVPTRARSASPGLGFGVRPARPRPTSPLGPVGPGQRPSPKLGATASPRGRHPGLLGPSPDAMRSPASAALRPSQSPGTAQGSISGRRATGPARGKPADRKANQAAQGRAPAESKANQAELGRKEGEMRSAPGPSSGHVAEHLE